MVGTFNNQRRAWRALPLLVALVGCVPDLSSLEEGEEGAGDQLNTTHAGAAGSAGGSAGGAGMGGAAPVAGSPAGGAGASGAPSAGAAGVMTAPTQCVPQGAETCNAKDDDCNGVIDDGCPSGVSTVFDQDMEDLGDSTGGSRFSDDCADGAVLAGIHLGMGSFLGQVKGVCRNISLEQSPNATSGYVVKLASDTELLPHPTTTADPIVKTMCNADEALVGVRISQQYTALADGSMIAVIPQVTLFCAKLTVTKQGVDYAVSWEGKRAMAPVSGTSANGTAWFAETSIPDGTVATRLGGASGAWMDRIALGVSKVVVARAQ